MKFENMPNNEEKTPEKAKITMKPDKAQNLEILDNFKNMQKILSENLLASNLNNNILQQQLQQEPTPHEVNERLTSLYDSFEPSTSKLKKILMTSKPQEPMNLTNYRNQSTVTSLESPGALVGGDRDKEFDSSVCDRISNVTMESPVKPIENSGSTKETPVKTTNLDSTISGSLSSLSSPNVSGGGGCEMPQENDANIAETPKETKVENHVKKSEKLDFKSPEKLPGIPLNSELEIKYTDGSNRTKIFESLIDVPSFNKMVTPGTVYPPFISPPLSAKNSFKSTENVTSTLKSGIATDPDRLPIASFVSPVKSSLSAKNPEIAGILASTLSTPPSTSSSISGPYQSSAAALAPNITAILTGTSRTSSSGNYSILNNEASKSSIINSTNPLGTFGLGPRNNAPLFSAPSVNTSRFVPGSIVGGNFVPEGLSKDLLEKQSVNSNCIGVPLNVNVEKAEDNKLPAMHPVKGPNYLSPGLGVTPLNNNSNVVETKVITTKPAKITTSEPTTITTTTEEISKQLEAIKNPSQPQKSSAISKDKGKLFLCTECNNAFSRSHLFNHIKTVHNKFTCLFCYGFFVTVEKLEKHLVKKHKVTYVEFHDDESFKKYLLDSSLTINNNTNSTDQLLGCNNQKQLVVTNRKTFRAVCCKCGDVLDCSDLEKHSCGISELPIVAATSVVNEEDNRAGEPMDLEEPMDIDQTIGSSLSLSAQDSNIFKVAEPATGFNGSVLKHIQHSVDNYLNQQQQQQQKMNSSQSEEHNTPIDSWRIEREPETENKLIVPKLKVKIPKFYHNQNLFDKIESEEDSGDEDSGSDSESDFNNSSKDEPKSVESEKEEALVSYYKKKEELEERMRELENQLTKKHKKRKEKDVVPEVAQEPSVAQEHPAMPPLSLKIKIRNITSNNMEAFVENITPGLDDEVQQNEKQTDLESEPMEIETQESQDSQTPEDRQDDSSQLSTVPEEMPAELLTADANGEPKEDAAPMEVPQEVENVPQRKVIIVDDVEVTPAGEESVVYKLDLSKGIDEIPMREFLKMCLKLMYPLCLYCNHARKIVVNGKSLALHFIQSHRFQAKVDGSDEEISPDTILAKFVENLSTLEECYFNLDTYDNFDQDKTEGHITISHDKLYECFQCRFQTHSHKELYLHNRKMHQKTLIVCLMCKINFYSYSELLCHICPGEPHKQQFLDYKFYCCLCNMDNIPSAFRLMVHLRKKHFACDVCLEKCNDQSKLSNHVWKHKLHHLCYRCGISYRNKADIMKHLFWKHGTEGITCKKCLQKKWPHVYHFCIPPTAFSCEVCNLQFTRALSLKVHRRLHENEEKYPCTEDDCEQKFISRKLLLKHVARYHFVPPPVDENVAPNKEENINSNIVIPIIPENHCCRTMPIQYRDAIKKIVPLAIEKPVVDAPNATETLEKSETLEKPQKKSKKNKNKEKPTSEEGNDDKEVALPDLPEMQLNLSESDSSDTEDGDGKAISMETEQTIPAPENFEPLVKASNLSDSDDSDEDEKKNDREIPKETVEKIGDDVADKCDVSNPVTDESKTNENDEEMKLDDLKPKTPTEPTDRKMSESENPEEAKQNLEPIKNIWENFKNFQEQQQQSILPSVQEPKDQDDSETEERIIKDMMENVVLHVVQSDHDYAKMYRPDDEPKTTDALKELDTAEKQAKPENPGKKSLEKSPKKRRKRENSSSSSGSDSSDSDSSSSGCSCKSNCSCSSSSSSGNSSDTESSSSDDEETPKKAKTRERETEFSTKSNDAIDVVATDDLAGTKNPADVIYESDLETDETDTDEDFYDEHPQKLASQMLTDKRLQLLQLNGEFDGIIENSRPSTPSLPPEELSLKKRIKIKKRKKDRKSSTSPMKKGHQLAPIAPSTPLAAMKMGPMYFGQSFITSTPTTTHDLSFRNTSTPLPPSVELHQEAEIRQLLQSHQHTQPVLPILKQLEDQKRLSDSIDSPQLSRAPSSATSSRKNSESSEPVKRSQRRRIPNKFYGYTSDDENQNASSTNPFKPIPPPNLTWRKEDLPSANKSRTQTIVKSTSSGSKKTPPCWSLVPYQPNTFSSLTQNQMEQFAPEQQQQQQFPTPAVIEPLRIPNVPVHHINMVPLTSTDPKSDVYSDSSDEEPPLQINDEPRRRRKKPTALSSSITSEAYPPPIPKLKLTIGNDNKIKRRNIKQKLPSGPPVMAAKKRKIPAPKNTKPAKKQKSNLSFGGDVAMYSQKTLFDDSFETNSSFSLSQSMTIPSTSLMPPAQLMRSPLSSNVDSQDFYSYNQQQSVSQKQIEMHEQIQKQQKLEDAILKTQQYYQQYNHQQIKPQNHQPREVKEGERLYCYCQSPYDEASEMIGCDGDSCQIEWFHFECVGILVAPKGKWYCPECQKQQNSSYPGV